MAPRGWHIENQHLSSNTNHPPLDAQNLCSFRGTHPAHACDTYPFVHSDTISREDEFRLLWKTYPSISIVNPGESPLKHPSFCPMINTLSKSLRTRNTTASILESRQVKKKKRSKHIIPPPLFLFIIVPSFLLFPRFSGISLPKMR